MAVTAATGPKTRKDRRRTRRRVWGCTGQKTYRIAPEKAQSSVHTFSPDCPMTASTIRKRCRVHADAYNCFSTGTGLQTGTHGREAKVHRMVQKISPKSQIRALNIRQSAVSGLVTGMPRHGCFTPRKACTKEKDYSLPYRPRTCQMSLETAGRMPALEAADKDSPTCERRE